MNDQVKRAAHLEATVSTMTADIHERQMRRATLFVRALDLACVELNARAPTASVEEWRSLLMVRASRQARPATCRKEMAPSELVAIANDLREELTKEAKQRQQAAGREHGRGQAELMFGRTQAIAWRHSRGRRQDAGPYRFDIRPSQAHREGGGGPQGTT